MGLMLRVLQASLAMRYPVVPYEGAYWRRGVPTIHLSIVTKSQPLESTPGLAILLDNWADPAWETFDCSP